MSYWAINGQNIDASTQTLTIEGRASPSLRDGDRIVIYERQQNGTVFTADAELVGTVLTQMPSLFRLTANLANYRLMQPARMLNHFTFSLQKVSNFIQPSLHFRRQYTSMSAEDYTTLVEGRIFWSRTAFGYYLNQLTKPALAAFVESIGRSNPRLLIGPAKFFELWKELQGFMQGDTVGAFRLLEAIESICNKLQVTSGALSFDDLGIDDDDGNLDPLATQHRRLKTFAATLQRANVPQDLFSEIDQRIVSDDATETAFEVLFAGTLWPTRMTFR